MLICIFIYIYIYAFMCATFCGSFCDLLISFVSVYLPFWWLIQNLAIRQVDCKNCWYTLVLAWLVIDKNKGYSKCFRLDLFYWISSSFRTKTIIAPLTRLVRWQLRHEWLGRLVWLHSLRLSQQSRLAFENFLLLFNRENALLSPKNIV